MYHKKTIDKGIKQIQGAERKLLYFPRDVELEHPYWGRHRFPREKYSKVFRLVVNLGEGEEFYPLVGKTNQEGFVSIINKDTLEIMLRELDTPRDLLQYLNEREKLFQVKSDIGKRGFLLTGREADLLSLYLKNGREFPFELYREEFAFVSLDIEGSWDEFRKRPEVIAREEANYNSYFIDELIRREILSLPGCDPFVRLLLSFNRIERRAISNAFVLAAREFEKLANPGYTFRRELPFGEKTLILLFYHSSLKPETREGLLKIALYGTAIHNHYAMKEIFCIGTSEECDRFHFLYDPDIMPLSEDEENEMVTAAKALNWFTALKRNEVQFHEYPMPSSEDQWVLRK